MDFKVAKHTSNYQVFTVKMLRPDVSIKSNLQRQLWQAIGKLKHLPAAAQLTPQTLPLHRFSSSNYVSYRSAIALRLSSAWQQTPLDIAHQLTDALLRLAEDSAETFSIDFMLEVLPPGWIIFRLSDRALATYLQECFKIPYFPSVSQNLNEKFHPKEGRGNRENFQHNQLDSDQLFPIQYVHARCCSLLRLADEQGLIEITDAGCRDVPMERLEARGDGDNEEFGSTTTHPSPITIVSPHPVPWLKDTGESEKEVHLRLTHPAAWNLIVRLLDLLDVISASDRQRWVKQGLIVSEACDQFYQFCRIWGEVKIHDLPLAQARLGLIGVTQVVLRSLLQEKLGVSAPRAL